MWMELFVIYLTSCKTVQSETAKCTSSNTCKYKGLCVVVDQNESCVECNAMFYKDPEHNCVEINFCPTANCNDEESECLPVWGSFYCKCSLGYVGRQCREYAPMTKTMSRPEVLFNPEPAYDTAFFLLVKFDGELGSLLNYNIRIDDKEFNSLNTRVDSGELKPLLESTDLYAVTPLHPKFDVPGSTNYILINTMVPEKPVWEINVLLSNGAYKQFEQTYTIRMVLPQLCVPDMMIMGCSLEKNKPTPVRRSNKLSIRSAVTPGCGNTHSAISELFISYHLYRLNTQYPNPTGLNKIYSTKPGANTTSFTMPAFSLQYGLHALEVDVDEIPARPSDKQKGSKQNTCYFSVDPKVIHTAIADGTEKTVGVQQVTVINASSSVDENEPSNTAMSYLIFSWSCSPPLPLSTYTGSVLMLEPGMLQVGTYNFTVTVSVDLQDAPTVGDYPRSNILPGPSSASQVITAVDGEAPLLSLVCVKNCGAPETLNIEEIIYLRVNCLSLCVGSDLPGYYQWSADKNLHFDSTTTEYGADTDRLIIKPNVIQPDTAYTITVSGPHPARAVTTLKANAPMMLPDNRCTITPSQGYSAKTSFNLICDYPTQLYHFPLTYTVFQRRVYKDTKSEMLVSCMNSPNHTNLILSCGDPNDGYKTYLTIEAQDENHIQYRKENAVSVVVHSLSEDPDTNLTLELPHIVDLASRLVDSGSAPELFRLVTSVMSTLDADPNATSEIREQIRCTFVNNLYEITLLSSREATQALMALHSVLEISNGTTIARQTVVGASHLLHKISANLRHEVADNKDLTNEHLKNASWIMKETADGLMSSMVASLKGFGAVSPQGLEPQIPMDKGAGIDYNDYGELDPQYLKYRNSYEAASMCIMSALENMARAEGHRMAIGEKESVSQSPHITTYIKVEHPALLMDQLLGGGNGEGIRIPKEVAVQIQTETDVVEVHVTVIDRNLFAWDPESRDMNTKLLIAQMINHLTGKEIELNVKQKIDMFLRPATSSDTRCILCTGLENATSPDKVSGTVSVPVKFSNDNNVLTDRMKVYKVQAKKGVKPLLLFEQPSQDLKVGIGINMRPSVEDMMIYSQTLATSVHVEGVAQGDFGYFYIAILPHQSALAEAAQYGYETFTRSYSFLVLLVGCRSWDIVKLRWYSEGCESGPYTTQERLHCASDHLSAFMGSMFVVPAAADEYHNTHIVLHFGTSFVISTFVIIILVLSLLLLLFTCWLDRRTKARYKAMLVILKDNVPGERYAYLIGVYTGNVSDSASTCNVSLQLFGLWAVSKAHLLSDARRRYIWSRNSDNWFVVYTSSWLGNLQSVSVWHDSWGHDPTWYCEKILVHDIQRGEVWVFLIQRYLSVLSGDGTIFCDKEPATMKQITDKHLLFKDHLNICWREEHMWLSVFHRHPRSKYLRTERLAVCVCYIMLCMLISIAMYGIPYNNPAKQIASIGSAGEVAREFMVILLTNIIVIPLVFPLLILFRKSAPKERELPPVTCMCVSCIAEDSSSTASSSDMSTTTCRHHRSSPCDVSCDQHPASLRKVPQVKVQSASRRSHYYTDTDSSSSHNKLPSEDEVNKGAIENEEHVAISWAQYSKKKLSRMKYILLDLILMDPLLIDGTMKKPENKRKEDTEKGGTDDYWSTIPRYWFPHYVKYLAWLLCILMIVVCALLVCTIGEHYSDIQSSRWILVVAMIILTSLLLWETFKVYVLTVILTYTYKVQAKQYHLHPDIYWDRSEAIHQIKSKHTPYVPVTKHTYQRMPLRRLKLLREKQNTRRDLGRLANDVLLYGIYMILQGVIIYALMNEMAYYSNKAVQDVIIRRPVLLAIGNYSMFVSYLKDTLLPALHKRTYYDVRPLGNEGITALYDTQLLGVALLHQVRVKKDACKIEGHLDHIFDHCRAEYSIEAADKSNYSIGWKKFDPDTYRKDRSSTPWLYREGYEKIYGKLHTYPRSGYIVELGRTLNNSLTIIDFLNDHQWFDQYTRVVRISFALLCVNENLFNIVSIKVEVGHPGVFLLTYNIDTVTLLLLYINLGWFMLMIIVLWMLMLIVFLMEKLLQLKRGSLMEYLKNFWNLVDLLIIAVALTAFLLTVLKNIKVDQLMNILEQNDESMYVDFSGMVLIQKILDIVTGFLICISTIRLWKLLHWNYTFRTCENSLFRASKTLISLIVITLFLVGCFGVFVYLYADNTKYCYLTLPQMFSTLLVGVFSTTMPPVQVLTSKTVYFGGPMLVMFWFTYVIFLMNMFITVIVYYYIVERAYYRYQQIQYGMVNYLKEEIAYQMGRYDLEYGTEHYYAAMSPHVMHYPWDMEPIASSKPLQLKNLCTLTITNSRLHVMRHIAKGCFTDSRLTNMRSICMRTLLELGAPEEYKPRQISSIQVVPRTYVSEDDIPEKAEIFHFGLENGRAKPVPESRLEEMNTTVNYHYYHMFSPSAAKQVDNTVNQILRKIDALPSNVKKGKVV